MNPLRPVLDALPGRHALVVGDALLDEYLSGPVERLAREAPVPVVTVAERRAVPGGAANTAANLAALGAEVRLLAVVGDDGDGRALLDALSGAGVEARDVAVDRTLSTVAKRRISAGEQMVVRIDEGRTAPPGPAAARAIAERLPALAAWADVVVVSDYGYGLLDDELLRRLAGLRSAVDVLVVDAHDVARFAAVRPTAVTPSWEEVAPLLAGHDVAAAAGADRARAVTAGCARLRRATGADVVAVTLDRDGAVVCQDGRPPYRTRARPVPHSRACGAGDSFTAAFALTLAAAGDAGVAAEVAQAAATVVSGYEGTVVCRLDELRELLSATATRLEPAEQLAERIEARRRRGARIVFTNGCFDLVHRGHIDLLHRARALGDVLVVGLNSDASIRRLKGPDRPINALEDRAGVLAALTAVDHLVAFDATTATELVGLLRPDVYVKGGDYTPQMAPEAAVVEANGGTVHILPYVEDRSTTALLERIRGSVAARPGPSQPR